MPAQTSVLLERFTGAFEDAPAVAAVVEYGRAIRAAGNSASTSHGTRGRRSWLRRGKSRNIKLGHTLGFASRRIGKA